MLYIMRHGQTDWNVRKKLQGQTDIPLNEEGRKMAREAAEKYRDVHFDICFCSPLVRARETAELLLEGRDVPIVVDERLIEMSFGVYEGIENSFAIPDCPINVLFWHPEQYEKVEGGENLEELYARTGNFLEEKVYPLIREGKDVLIVGHGGMNLSISNRIQGVPLKDYWKNLQGNCKVVKLDVDGSFQPGEGEGEGR